MKPKHILVLLAILIVGILLFTITNYKNLKPNTDFDPIKPKGSSNYKCPETDYLDCMPSVNSNLFSETAKICEDKKYIEWIQNNCPSFKGVAY